MAQCVALRWAKAPSVASPLAKLKATARCEAWPSVMRLRSDLATARFAGLPSVRRLGLPLAKRLVRCAASRLAKQSRSGSVSVRNPTHTLARRRRPRSRRGEGGFYRYVSLLLSLFVLSGACEETQRHYGNYKQLPFLFPPDATDLSVTEGHASVGVSLTVWRGIANPKARRSAFAFLCNAKNSSAPPPCAPKRVACWSASASCKTR